MDIYKLIKEEFNKAQYLSWKRKNITIRGVKEYGQENGGGAMLGRGLYTAFLSNKQLAKEYGKVLFVIGAIPKNPKIFNTLNDWEIFEYNKIVYPYLKKINPDKVDRRDFSKYTTIEDEMMKLGFDGVIIKGREMVHYKPNEDELMYFDNERQLIIHYEHINR